MHKIIYSSYELDLTPFKITTVEENHWFSDQFFTKYSFPFDIKLIEALIKVFGNLLDDNNVVIETYFEVLYVEGNKIETAILEINSQKGLILNAKIRYGFDELPNWNKKLAELPLEVLSVGDIYFHAKTVIPQTWPAVNYNFPQIHTDKYDPLDETWSTFQKIINNYKNGDFLINTYIVEDFANRNIVHPLPYFMHILTAGFLDAGYTLKGDVTTNDVFKKLCLFADVDYFNFSGLNIQYLIVKGNEYVTFINGIATYYNEIILEPSTTYRVTGLATSMSLLQGTAEYSFLKVRYKSTELFYVEQTSYTFVDDPAGYVDATFTTDNTTSQQLIFEAKSSDISAFSKLFDIKIEKIVNGVGSAKEVRMLNDVDLTKTVPDITFGTFISVLKNWFNIDLDIVGKDIYMNFIENEINYNDAENLSNFEVLEPAKTFNNDVSFLLKFADVDSEAYKYDVIFQNKAGFEASDKNVTSKTNTITIDALPLPQKYAEGVGTAFAFDHGGNNKIYTVLYDGLNAEGLNLTKDITPVLIPAIHQKHYIKWFGFRINAINYEWTFKMFSEKLEKIKKKVWAYGRYHIVKSMSKTQIDEDLYEVDIETHSMP